jgi:flagellar basal body-associated protein FliL
MAEEQAATKPASKSKRLPLILGLVLGVAIAEGAAFFLVFKMNGGGPTAAKAEGSHAESTPAEGAKAEGGHGSKTEGEAAAPAATSQPATTAEVTVLRNLRVPNEKSGRMWIYDLDISVVVSAGEKERVEGLVKQRGGEIGDTLARIIRSAPDRMLRETDLRALRYQVLEALRSISGEENLVQKVLIPRFVPIPAN